MGKLALVPDEAITNYEPHRAEWVATLIVTAESPEESLEEKVWGDRTDPGKLFTVNLP